MANVIKQQAFLTALSLTFALPVSGTALAEPSIETKEDGNGFSFRTQTYEAAPIKLSVQVLPIAERYRWANKWAGVIPAINAHLICEIADDGTIKYGTCEADSWSNREQQLAMVVVRASKPSAFLRYPAIDRAALKLGPIGADPVWSKLVRFTAGPGNEPPFYRLVKLAVSIDTAPLLVDLTTGPLVTAAQIDIQSGRAMRGANYPVRALRDKRQGVQTAECQIQADFSVICRGTSFDPPQNAPYFVEEAANLYRGAIMKDQLKDGRSSIGVRFQTRLRWTLPAEQE